MNKKFLKLTVIASKRSERSNHSFFKRNAIASSPTASRNDKNLISRSEMTTKPVESSSGKELGQWLLWAGISPESQRPMSRIGIYTDFT